MKSVVVSAILCSIFLCCAAARVQPYTGLRCTPGETILHSDGCNTCFCVEPGYVAGCTYKLCRTEGLKDESEVGRIINPFGDEPARLQPYTGLFRRRCIPGDTYLAPDGCNHCICPEPGQVAACTKYPCIRVPQESDESDVREVSRPLNDESFVFENATHCTPDTQFFLGCNICYCQSSGIKSGSPCENLGCPPFPPLYDSALKCTPGVEFMQACNYCTCGRSGIVGDSMCTLMNCVELHP